MAVYIATRPDCVSDEYLAMLAELKERRHIDICVELGLQRVNYHALRRIRRGHTLGEFIDAVLRMAKTE